MTSPHRLEIQKRAAGIAKEVSAIVNDWGFFHQQTMGIQLVRAADSIGSNISEGYGRSSTAERIQFILIADGSLYEVKYQVALSYDRGLITESTAKELDQRLLSLSISMIEFCHSLLEQDPAYKGPYRERIPKRMWWRRKKHP
ncbi:MAG: four helix bundle protein [Ignavibacteriae bacterium]|nr:MAG: four helix bundle protein [Ignavibacteriota bacterium]